jgi:hypothetical protein
MAPSSCDKPLESSDEMRLVRLGVLLVGVGGYGFDGGGAYDGVATGGTP